MNFIVQDTSNISSFFFIFLIFELEILACSNDNTH